MRLLRHTVAFCSGETAASFISRLAAFTGRPRDICLDMATTFQKIVDGDPKALAIVAFKASADPAALAENALVQTAERRYVHRGQELTRDKLRRAPVVVCPKCLAEDSAAAPQTRPPVAASQPPDGRPWR